MSNQAPELPPVTTEYWKDPFPDWQGMLSSDLIAYYNVRVGGMIGPWNDDLLKPAAYELTLGDTCLVDGKIKTLSEQDPWLELPSNSIVFVSVEQWVRLPHYIAARFDLAIEFIYQGILLGTGPQVDPGFQGFLSCPLHNISSASVHIRRGNPFAKMDFAKTSGLRYAVPGSGPLSFADEKDLYAAALAASIKGKDGKPVRLFNHEKRWRPPIFATGYAGQKQVRSSVKPLEDDVMAAKDEIREFGNEIRRLRRFGLASAVGVILAIASLLITLAQLDRTYTDSRFGELKSQPTQASNPALRSEIATQRRELLQLRLQVAELSGRVASVSPSTPGK